MRATLHRLLTALRTVGIVPQPPKPASSFDDELQRYDEYMDSVRGLAPQTRLHGRAAPVMRCREVGSRAR